METLEAFSFEVDGEGPDDWADLYNDSSYPYEGGTVCEGGAALQAFYQVFQPLLYGLIFLLGAAGNGLMITVLLTRRRRLRVTELYLLHLAVADLLLLLALPFQVMGGAGGWPFGEFLCKMVGLLKNLNVNCGSFLIACIAFDRYLAVVHAVPSLHSRRPGAVHLTCVVLWLVCFGLSLPNAVFLSLRGDGSSPGTDCSYYSHGLHAHNWVLAKRLLHHVCFFLPLAAMSFCYTALAVALCNGQKSRTKRGAVRLSLLVTVAFCCCWLPYNVALLVKTLADLGVVAYRSCAPLLLLQPALDVTESLGVSHCCLNPFLYAFAGVRFRAELVQLLCGRRCVPIGRPLVRARGHGRASTTDGATSLSTVVS